MRRYDRHMDERLHSGGRPIRPIRPYRRPIFFVSPRERLHLRRNSSAIYVVLIIFLILFFISFLIMCFFLF